MELLSVKGPLISEPKVHFVAIVEKRKSYGQELRQQVWKELFYSRFEIGILTIRRLAMRWLSEMSSSKFRFAIFVSTPEALLAQG